MWQSGDIAYDTATTDIFTNRKRRLGFCAVEFFGVNYLSQRDCGDHTIGNFDTYQRNPIRNCRDTHTGRTQTKGNVIGQTGDSADFYAGVGLQLISGDGRPAGNMLSSVRSKSLLAAQAAL